MIYGHFDTTKQIFAERGWKLCETEVNTQAQGDYHWSFLRVTGDLNKLLGLDQGFADHGFTVVLVAIIEPEEAVW